MIDHHRAEHLFLRDAHVRRDVVDDAWGRRSSRPRVPGTVYSAPSTSTFGAACLRLGDVALDALLRLARDHRADVAPGHHPLARAPPCSG